MEVSKFPTVQFFGTDAASNARLDLSAQGSTVAALARCCDETFPHARRVGLIFRSTPALLLSWLGVLASGREPLILQFPTAKQVFSHWRDSVETSIGLAALDGLIVDPSIDVDAFSVPGLAVSEASIEALPRSDESVRVIEGGAMLQLSSGTTGSRKPLRFTLDQVLAHIEDYAGSFLKPDDRIVSWLPLYHDMGFVACWLMALVTGTPLVLIDPIDWTTNPALLFEAVQRFEGTICYLPNFAFEVMARATGHGPFSTMRAWISCSEPVYEAAIRRFMATTGAPASTICACYAMAENVFAVTQSRGLVLTAVDGQTRVSCGAPIPNCEIEVREGQIWVKSRSSMRNYVGSEPIVDANGFYPTGDLGTLTPEGLVITGRIADLINIAGRKYLLNDLDRALQRVVPEAGGHIVTCVQRSDDLGTEQPVFFVEDAAFYRRTDEVAIRDALVAETGITNCVVHLVPPAFILKTSSGKAARAATFKRWTDRKGARSGSDKSLAQDIDDAFGALPRDRPFAQILDSLGQVYMRLLTRLHGMSYDAEMTLGDLMSRADAVASGPAAAQHLSIVALCDRHVVAKIDTDALQRLSEVAGCPVTIEHINAPPSEILLNDIIFLDYFRDPAKAADYDAIAAVIDRIKRCSLLIVDDVSELAFPFEQVYPQLDHRHRRTPEADLLGFRWQQYTLRHHLLPVTAVWGGDLKKDATTSIDDLSTYLGRPVLRLATLPMFIEATKDWDVVERVNWRHDGALYQPPGLEAKISEWIATHDLPRITGPVDTQPQPRDLPHFCGWALDEGQIEDIVQRHNRFLILGTRSSLTWIPKRLDALQKTYTFVNSVDLSHIDRDSFDCVLMTGAWGEIINGAGLYQPVYHLLWGGFYTTKFDYIGERLRNLRLTLEGNYASISKGEGPLL